MSKPAIPGVFKALQNGLLRRILHTTRGNIRVPRATQWTVLVQTLYMSKPVIALVLEVLSNGLLWYIL